jgi:GMP synthase (glutamine-hydrolysing)
MERTDTIVICDFGGQTAQLIARRIREIGVYTEIVPGDAPLEGELRKAVKGIIFSGSPYSVGDEQPLWPHGSMFSTAVPLLGICYGTHVLIEAHGGRVSSLEMREYGRARVYSREASPIFDGIPDGFVSWMSHGDSIDSLGEGASVAAESENGIIAAVHAADRSWYGLQFHPEVSHCEHGRDILENFAVKICGARRSWSMERYIRETEEEIRATVGEREVMLLISGGVDSTVTAGLLLRALPAEQVHLLHIDTGLMRKNESKQVVEDLKALGARNFHFIDASEEFLEALSGVADPEKKREVIGDLFIRVQEREVDRLGIRDSFLAQGTLYTDLIESGKGVGKKAQVIKSHHNVRSPLVEEKRSRGLVVEPLRHVYKDEVRAVGEKIGISGELVHRHPFPGPGLAVRILGEVTEEKCRILREADALYVEELKRRELYDSIWQAFSVLLPLRSVGVTGDARNYGYVLALRAVTSSDGMTADVFPFPAEHLLEISALITNSVREVGRVVYDISSKPPSTIEWE